MHPTSAFRANPLAVQRALVEDVGFAQVFAQTDTGPHVAHTPVVAAGDDAVRFHLARANALARVDAVRALVTLTGPDAYISPRWYADAEQVPTWNYIAIELVGTMHRLPDANLEPLLEALVEKHEAAVRGGGTPWTMAKMSGTAKRALIRGIRAFELRIEERRETVKLSQNKSETERARLVAGLRGEGALAMAGAMQKAAR